MGDPAIWGDTAARADETVDSEQTDGPGPVVGWSVGFLMSSPGTLSSHSPIRLLKGAIKISWCKADSRLLDFLGVATLEILNH